MEDGEEDTQEREAQVVVEVELVMHNQQELLLNLHKMEPQLG